MSHVSYTELRSKLAQYMDEVCDSRSVLHITRQNARTVVMISEAEYEGLLETVHLLKSPANARRIADALREVESGKLVEHDIAPSGKTPVV